MILLAFIGAVAVCGVILALLRKFKDRIGKAIYLMGTIIINIAVVGMLAAGLFVTATEEEIFQTLAIAFISYLFFLLERATNNYNGIKEDYTDKY